MNFINAGIRGFSSALLVALCCAGTPRASAQAPTISGFHPLSGGVGSTVVIDGANFTALQGVTFAGNAIAAGSYTATTITVVVPEGAQTGPITVQTGSGSASTASDFTVGTTFFTGEIALSNGVYYLQLPNGNTFGYYSYLDDPQYIYHFDLGYEYLFEANDGKSGIYLYDFASNDFFYTSPTFPFPFLYDFNLKTVLYYFTGTSNPRRFYDFSTGQYITK